MRSPSEYPHITLDEAGNARIGDTRYKVVHLAGEHYHYGWTAEEIMRQHPDLKPQEVYAALGYFFDHYDAMVAKINEDVRASDLSRFPQPWSREELLQRTKAAKQAS